MPSKKPILAGPHRRLTLIAMIRRSRRMEVCRGELSGRLEGLPSRPHHGPGNGRPGAPLS
jgi:hypothetical protein